MGITIIIILTVVIAGIFFLLRFLRNVQPDDTELEQDLKELKASIAQFKGGFVEWNEGISANDIDQIVEKANQRTAKGVFMSPNNNPVFAYAFRNYIGPGKNSLVYILSLDHEYVFRTTTKGTEVTIDGEKKGLIRADGVLYDIRNNEVAKIKRHGATSTNTILFGEKEAAKIALPDAIAKIEAVEITGVDLDDLQKETVKTLAVYDLVHSMDELGV
jgi:hypothetical protein